MVKKVSTSEARAHFGDVVNSVYYSKEPVAVEKKGRVLAVLISPERFQRMQDAEDRNWEIVESAWERVPERDADEVLAEAVEEVKQMRREVAEKRRAD
jgi:prevent-host-death family protein